MGVLTDSIPFWYVSNGINNCTAVMVLVGVPKRQASSREPCGTAGALGEAASLG